MSAFSTHAALAATTTVPTAPDADVGWRPAASLGDRLRSRPIVVALNGEAVGASAVRVAAALERRYHCRVSAVQVLDDSDRSLLAPFPSACTFTQEIGETLPYANEARVCRQQVSDWLGSETVWPIHISAGAAAYEISRYADDTGAELIVTGLRSHADSVSCLRDETTLTVARVSSRAVLAVTPELFGLPRRVVVGVDFGPTSLRVARAARDVLQSPTSTDPAHLRLVHVHPSTPGEGVEGAPGESLVRNLGVTAAFEQLVRELAAPVGVQVECVSRQGPVLAELRACAEESRADLVVVGGFGGVERHLHSNGGGVTTGLIRDGRCSVLVVPPSTAG